ncbi:NAD(P)-dependent dehydrogenase (short-subunit alcohol dehydrogenase family) [Streptosporangium becharense]|uniref:NAD(P)-dependent dehydrogenase (Short-subunit alcohol dehydrogenase family) n=1 Tax=Streptosporangium becharense TaxID=1816182 RepID=A0A7W9ICV9_9ACTN|nr:SDR family oxidoreductase [Streptosporangium becharense]MBB2913803.1 NAD(P)-dependent dehydrogenase (short-subunit alcohol dehydrogenase family) [Streptosporangium becharense]MBB5817884.1 NAD(P)-dependent dehydrogenase (short-subunit alcohol dehydrogenase family) [Streptosporangium becharense]
MGKLAGKVALVTGGSRGIGAATARALAEDGADVAVSYTTSSGKAEAVAGELRARGVRAAAFRADQADPRDVEGLIGAVVEHFGRLDILVNNAAVFVLGPVDGPDGDVAAFTHQQAVNYSGVVATIRAAAKVMEDGGRIITVGSVVSARAGWPGVADYATTKGAAAGYTRAVARDLAARGITANVVQVGCADTDMNPADGVYAPGFMPGIALGRYARPEEIAAPIAFLAGPGASYITGAVLNVDGGYQA